MRNIREEGPSRGLGSVVFGKFNLRQHIVSHGCHFCRLQVISRLFEDFESIFGNALQWLVQITLFFISLFLNMEITNLGKFRYLFQRLATFGTEGNSN